jgi:RNA polymerase sigma-B factor
MAYLDTRVPSRSHGPTSRPTDSNELFVRWQGHGEHHAREELVQRFMPLASKLAARYQGAREPLDDLVQVASLGLVKAIDRFDPARGIAFASFAVPTILGELKRYFRDLGWSVHVPRGCQERALKVEEAQRKLATAGRAPTFNELAEYLEWSIEDVLDAVEAAAAHHAVSLDAPVDGGDGETATLAESFGREDQRFELVDAGTTIADAARHLDERERRVLALRFIEDRTQMEIAQEIGVSQMQVSRILRKSVARLQELVSEGDMRSSEGDSPANSSRSDRNCATSVRWPPLATDCAWSLPWPPTGALS